MAASPTKTRRSNKGRIAQFASGQGGRVEGPQHVPTEFLNEIDDRLVVLGARRASSHELSPEEVEGCKLELMLALPAAHALASLRSGVSPDTRRLATVIERLLFILESPDAEGVATVRAAHDAVLGGREGSSRPAYASACRIVERAAKAFAERVDEPARGRVGALEYVAPGVMFATHMLHELASAFPTESHVFRAAIDDAGRMAHIVELLGRYRPSSSRSEAADKRTAPRRGANNLLSPQGITAHLLQLTETLGVTATDDTDSLAREIGKAAKHARTARGSR